MRSRWWTSPSTTTSQRQAARLERSGARIYKTRGKYRTYAAAPWIVLRHTDFRRLRPPYFLRVGGSTPVGCVGFVDAALELAAQVNAGVLPEPSHVVVALGSGGTAAGLAAGLRLAGLRTRVVGIVVNDRTPVGAPVVAKLARRTLDLLRRRGAALPSVTVGAADLDAETAWLGEGYGHATPAGGARTCRRGRAGEPGARPRLHRQGDGRSACPARAGPVRRRARALLAEPRHDRG